MTYSEILARLEAATGPDREIDCMIGYAVDLTAHLTEDQLSFRQSADCRKQDWAIIAETFAPDSGLFWSDYLPPYTASLDAVTALIESELPGWVRSVAGRSREGFKASVWSDYALSSARAATEPLALLTATIRALADKEAS